MPAPPYRLGTEPFVRLVEQAVARLPESITPYLDNVIITVQPRPTTEMLAELGMAADEELFGLYTGVPLNERSRTEPSLYPDTIILFQEPLEAACATRQELIAEIEITVVHEIAHLVGFTDAELEALGYG